MNLLHYEFIDGPDDSINGMLRKLVTDLRYNRSNVPIEQFKQVLPDLRKIENRLQELDGQIGQPRRNYIDEIFQELDQESENEINIEDDLNRSTNAIITTLINKPFDFQDLDYVTGKAQHYHWLQFSGYSDRRGVDANLILAKEAFRSICNKYNYIFIDLS